MAIGNWGYPNGNIPPSAMEEAGGVLWKPSVARQVRAWIAACARRGVELVWDEGYRDRERQQFWADYWEAHGQPENAATVGESSHGLGQAGDADMTRYTDAEEAVIVEEGERFGMVRNYMPAEPWHFADVGTVTGDLDNTPSPTPTPLNRKAFNMDKVLIQFADAGTIILWDLRDGKDGKRAQHVQTVIDAQRLSAIYGPVAVFDSQAEWEIIRPRYGLGN